METIKPIDTRENAKEDLRHNLKKIHTTALGLLRVKRNLTLLNTDAVAYVLELIKREDSVVLRRGKNFYLSNSSAVVTINASSYTIITAHKK